MILITVTYDNDTTLRISNDELELEHYWEPWVTKIDNISFTMEYKYGGVLLPEWGSISISAKAFDSVNELQIPPKFIYLQVEYTQTTEAAATTLISNAVGELVNSDDLEVTYNIYIEDILDIPLLDKTSSITARATTSYDGVDVVIPRAIGEIIYQAPLRLNDYDIDSSAGFAKPTYHTGYLQGTKHTDWHIYDDGVDICSNATVGNSGTTGADTFYLDYEAVGEVTVSGYGTFPMSTGITDAIDAILSLKILTVTGVATYERSGASEISDWVDSQILLRQYISKLAACHAHLLNLSIVLDSGFVLFYCVKLEHAFSPTVSVWTDNEFLPVNIENDASPITILKTNYPYREQVDEGGRVFVKEVINELVRVNSAYWEGVSENTSSSASDVLLDTGVAAWFTRIPASNATNLWLGSDQIRNGHYVLNIDDQIDSYVVSILNEHELQLNDDIFVGGENYEIGYKFKHGQELSVDSLSLDEDTINDNLKFIMNFLHQRFWDVSIPMDLNTLQQSVYGVAGMYVVEERRYSQPLYFYYNKIIGMIYDFENELITYKLDGCIYKDSVTDTLT